MAEPEGIALAACDAQGPRGFAMMQFGDEHAHLALLAVQPALQRQQVGNRLVQWLPGSARVAGIATVRLELRAGKPGALAFYAAQGFEVTGRIAGYHEDEDGLDALRMQLSLRG